MNPETLLARPQEELSTLSSDAIGMFAVSEGVLTMISIVLAVLQHNMWDYSRAVEIRVTRACIYALLLFSTVYSWAFARPRLGVKLYVYLILQIAAFAWVMRWYDLELKTLAIGDALLVPGIVLFSAHRARILWGVAAEKSDREEEKL